MKILKITLSAVVTILSVVAITLSCIAFARQDDMKIMDAYEIGLRNFFMDEITEMYAESGAEPVYGNFYDTELLAEFQNTVQSAVYQKTSSYEIDSADGSGAVCYVQFKTADNSYSFGVLGSKLSVNIDGDKNYYSSGSVTTLYRIILQAIDLVAA